MEKLKLNHSLAKIGDDCAVLPLGKKHDLLVTSDLLVEDIDFRRAWMIPELLGHKTLAVSLSDIAAMGGKPQYSLLSIGIPEDIWKTDFVDQLYEGYLRLAAQFEVELIGGDVSRTPDKIVIDSTVIGEVERNMAVARSGAKPGDLIFVSGALGGSRAGLEALEANLAGFDELKKRQLSPIPRIFEGQKLVKLVTSMIDISDGFLSDLAHICDASNVGAKLFRERFPIDPGLKFFAADPQKQLEFAMNGGEDFELLFTIERKHKTNDVLQDFFCVGEITEMIEGISLIDKSSSFNLNPNGYRHF